MILLVLGDECYLFVLLTSSILSDVYVQAYASIYVGDSEMSHILSNTSMLDLLHAWPQFNRFRIR